VETKRYQVEAQTQGSDIWKPICYTDDLHKAESLASAMLHSGETEVARIVDQETGQVWLVKIEVHNPDGSEL
jgi:hypothetical protein